jgi:hypothetical protein
MSTVDSPVLQVLPPMLMLSCQHISLHRGDLRDVCRGHRAEVAQRSSTEKYRTLPPHVRHAVRHDIAKLYGGVAKTRNSCDTLPAIFSPDQLSPKQHIGLSYTFWLCALVRYGQRAKAALKSIIRAHFVHRRL